MTYRYDTITSDFKCKHCHNYVSTDPLLSGVNNRNHCPYCLWSRHLDLHNAGDRLAACKAEMKPVALTFKRSNKKYGSMQGELMLVHLCTDCGSISINRSAADDDAETILTIFEHSQRMDGQTRALVQAGGIQMAGARDVNIVRARLFGWKESGQAQYSSPAYESEGQGVRI